MNAVWEVGAHIRNVIFVLDLLISFHFALHGHAKFLSFLKLGLMKLVVMMGEVEFPQGFHFLVGAGLERCRQCRALSANAKATS